MNYKTKQFLEAWEEGLERELKRFVQAKPWEALFLAVMLFLLSFAGALAVIDSFTPKEQNLSTTLIKFDPESQPPEYVSITGFFDLLSQVKLPPVMWLIILVALWITK